MAERIAAVLGFAFLVVAVGYFLRGGLATDDSPPDVAVTVDSILPQRDGFLVEIRAFNRGGAAAAAVTVEGVLRTGSGEERAETTFDFVPARSERAGGLVFRTDPRRGELELRVLGYSAP
ncbi:MAG TPA: hypothetical protein VNK43_03750 [Gemmatimonadales bacterium]|nr:hypothetical protein [Gemmatimonadales bacterium]